MESYLHNPTEVVLGKDAERIEANGSGGLARVSLKLFAERDDPSRDGLKPAELRGLRRGRTIRWQKLYGVASTCDPALQARLQAAAQRVRMI